MRFPCWQAVVWALATCGGLHGIVAAQESPRTALERIAREIPGFDAASFLFDRPIRRPTDDHRCNELVRDLLDAAHPRDALVELLRHEDPRVRTLALGALFAKEDPQTLPTFVSLTRDDAPTIPRPTPYAAALTRDGRKMPPEPPPTPQTVGEVALQFVNAWLETAGFCHRVTGSQSRPGFDEYWERHAKRSWAAGWFEVQLQRAGQGSMPTPPDRLPRLRALRQRIDAIPEPDRCWTLLWLRGVPGGEHLASEEELVAACAAAGPEKLLRVLRRDVPGDDPTFAPLRTRGSHRAQLMIEFILRHAERLLTSVDDAALEEIERKDESSEATCNAWPIRSAWWSIARARLVGSPRGPAILRKALGRFTHPFYGDHGGALAAELSAQDGESSEPELVEWFYREEPAGLAPARRAFLEAVAGHEPRARPRRLLAEIIADPRFATLDWPGLAAIVRAANRLADVPIVGDREFREAWHPIGFEIDVQAHPRIRPEHAPATERLLSVLDAWRTTLRAATQSWRA